MRGYKWDLAMLMSTNASSGNVKAVQYSLGLPKAQRRILQSMCNVFVGRGQPGWVTEGSEFESQ
jgi:hypothetical protein